jgi:hypothetical protein
MGGAHPHHETGSDSTGIFWMEFLGRRREFITLVGGAATFAKILSRRKVLNLDAAAPLPRSRASICGAKDGRRHRKRFMAYQR